MAFEDQVSHLHPSVRGVALQFLQAAFQAGLDPRVQETFRSRERQDQLYAQGRSAPGAIVTKAPGGHSNHNYGVAFDVVPGSVLNVKNWDPENASWARLGEIGKQHGLEWGGDWKFVDKPHFQLAGANWRKLQNDPEFASYAPQVPGSPAPAFGPAREVGERPVAVAGGAPAAAPGGGAPEGQRSGIAKLFANLAPEPVSEPGMIGGGVGEEFAPAVFGAGDPMGATMSAMQGAQSAGELAKGLMPDIGALMGLGKKRVVG